MRLGALVGAIVTLPMFLLIPGALSSLPIALYAALNYGLVFLGTFYGLQAFYHNPGNPYQNLHEMGAAEQDEIMTRS